MFDLDLDLGLDPEPAGETSLVGAIARYFGLINSVDLDTVQEAVGYGEVDLVGAELAERGLITQDQLTKLQHFAELLQTRHDDRAYGEMALETGFVSPDEIEYAFQAQQALYAKEHAIKTLGALLVDYGSLTTDLRDEILAQQGRLNTD